MEAIERLAQQAGVTLRYEGDSAAERRAAARRNALFHANEEAAKLYQRMLLDGREAEDARAYVKERGLSAESHGGRSGSATRRATRTSCSGASRRTSVPTRWSRPGSPRRERTAWSATGSGRG